MKDGLYRVVTEHFVAGFVLKNGIVVACAPILRKRLGYWVLSGRAEWIADNQKDDEAREP